ncbi:hypothetical protein ABPG77_003812 [Micractinium sp. CCAP 211/92]
MGLAFFSKRRTLQLKPSVAPVGEAESAASRQQGALSSPSSQEQQQQQGQAERWQGPGKGSLSARWAAGSARSPSEGSDDLASVSGYCDIDSSECSGEGGAAGAAARRDCSHRFGIDYLRHPVAAYCQLPTPLRQLTSLPTPLRTIMVAARPTIEPSGGLRHYRDAMPRHVRRWSPFLAVVDEPGLPAGEIAGEGGKYHWVEIPIPPAYRLDLSGVASYEQYVSQVMGKNQRRNHRLRRQRWAQAGVLTLSYEPLVPGDKATVKQLWGLYRQNGERNGQLVVGKRDFWRIHLRTEGLHIMAVRDTSRQGALVCFATGVKCGDTLVSTWCGTDYSHPLARDCSCYVMTQYEFVRQAIADPEVRWLDLGALHRTIKAGSLCAEPHALSTYLRCKGRRLAQLLGLLAGRWFTLQRLEAAGVIRDV